jgi:hypothetical protein
MSYITKVAAIVGVTPLEDKGSNYLKPLPHKLSITNTTDNNNSHLYTPHQLIHPNKQGTFNIQVHFQHKVVTKGRKLSFP